MNQRLFIFIKKGSRNPVVCFMLRRQEWDDFLSIFTVFDFGSQYIFVISFKYTFLSKLKLCFQYTGNNLQMYVSNPILMFPLNSLCFQTQMMFPIYMQPNLCKTEAKYLREKFFDGTGTRASVGGEKIGTFQNEDCQDVSVRRIPAHEQLKIKMPV